MAKNTVNKFYSLMGYVFTHGFGKPCSFAVIWHDKVLNTNTFCKILFESISLLDKPGFVKFGKWFDRFWWNQSATKTIKVKKIYQFTSKSDI